MKIKNCLTIDLGATSGRAIVATFDGAKVSMREIARFDNPMIPLGGHLFWDLPALYNNIVSALRTVASEALDISSMAIDTWGCDFAMFGADGQLLSLPYCYRDSHTEGAMERLFERMPKEEVYGRTGIQFMEFNSLFQLDTLRRNNCTALQSADKILFIPDALGYMLTGEAVMEYTVASTSQIVNAEKGDLDEDLLRTIGLRREQFGRLVQPGTVIGRLCEQVQRATGVGAIEVVAVAGHDTASAVVAVPTDTTDYAYLSCGTWSLLGVESPRPIISEQSYNLNFTNEGGTDHSIRFLKNICGMWLFEQSRKAWSNAPQSVAELVALCETTQFASLIDPDAPCFVHPESMVEAIAEYCRKTGQEEPRTAAEYCRCIFRSLAMRYRQVVDMLEEITPVRVSQLNVIGGGSRNEYLMRYTASALGRKVVAGPAECTALGNALVQLRALGDVATLAEMRAISAASCDTKSFEPTDTEAWQREYEKFLEIQKRYNN
ncbi:MAG: rhamnulokinase [Rikenellaceae bacterium]|nr:rhamnulokinase [Rikenellaceae bacterium]